MRRASSVFAVLAFAAARAAGRGRGAADRHVQSQSRADPGLPAHGEHPRRRRRGARRIQDRRDRIRRVPAPAVGVNFYLPEGTKLHTVRLPDVRQKRCSNRSVPRAARRALHAGPIGNVLGIVSFGSERVEEDATLESFYSPGGGFEFFTNGHSPVSLEILSAGKYVNLGGAGGFGPELMTQVPLVSTVPGRPSRRSSRST